MPEELDSEEREVIEQCGTEPSFSSELLDIEEDGVFKCKKCGQELFDSEKSTNQYRMAKLLATQRQRRCRQTTGRPQNRGSLLELRCTPRPRQRRTGTHGKKILHRRNSTGFSYQPSLITVDLPCCIIFQPHQNYPPFQLLSLITRFFYI